MQRAKPAELLCSLSNPKSAFPQKIKFPSELHQKKAAWIHLLIPLDPRTPGRGTGGSRTFPESPVGLEMAGGGGGGEIPAGLEVALTQELGEWEGTDLTSVDVEIKANIHEILERCLVFQSGKRELLGSAAGSSLRSRTSRRGVHATQDSLGIPGKGLLLARGGCEPPSSFWG